jgi:hypothetical protein
MRTKTTRRGVKVSEERMAELKRISAQSKEATKKKAAAKAKEEQRCWREKLNAADLNGGTSPFLFH